MSLRRRPTERTKNEEEPNKISDLGSNSWPLDRDERRIWLICLVIRVINALMVQTYFNPDEHWQGPEVAHRLVLGYGHLTWEWKKGIRSYLHPLIFALLYKVLAFLHLDTPLVMSKAPRILQSIFASVGDVYLYKLSKLVFDEHVAQWALFCQMLNWFMFFCITRTLSTSLETVLTTVDIFYWFLAITTSKKSKSYASRKLALAIAALACAIRPTSAITWLYVGLMDLFQVRSKFKFIFLEVIPVGSFILALSCLVDRLMYQSWVIVPFNFLKFNFLSSGGDYYGTHAFHWYFTQGFPSMVWTFLPFTIIGIVKSRERMLSGLMVWVLGLYSVLGHKEFRFVLPVLPITLMFSGYCLASMERQVGHPDAKMKNRKSTSAFEKSGSKSKLNFAIVFLLLSNVPMAAYMTSVHQRGTEDVMQYLSTEAHEGKVSSILFLMPCHSIPFYSSLHYNATMHFLDCTPSEERGVMDESDQFMSNPTDFVKSVFSDSGLLNFSHIALFESEEKLLRDLLLSIHFVEVFFFLCKFHNRLNKHFTLKRKCTCRLLFMYCRVTFIYALFRKERRFFHSHFKVDRDLQSSVVVYSREN